MLSQCCKAQEPQLLEPMHQEPMVREKQGWCTKPGKRPLPATTRESLCAATKIQFSQKKVKKKKKNEYLSPAYLLLQIVQWFERFQSKMDFDFSSLIIYHDSLVSDVIPTW